MPPEVSHFRAPQITPSVQFSITAASGSSPKFCRAARRMKFSGKTLLPVLIFILSCLSILRLLKIAITTSHSTSPASALSSTLQQECSSPSECSEVTSNAPGVSRPHKSSANATLLTPKEFKLLSNLITRKAPCNLLVFGLQSQYLNLSSINAGGVTLFLEDDPYKISEIKADSNGTRIHKVKYQVPAKKAYSLLKHARGNPACAPSTSLLQQSTCKLALRNLPKEVYQLKWDVVVVDGPIGDGPEAPGRMSTIYTASMLARVGRTTDVVVHDVHRTVEKWFSWEFLCEENLVSAKGKFWNFRIPGQSNSTRFCSPETVRIE
ncbi:PREDICTED: glucuronoxylan 4-O-methyltransferase 1 [Theobroma cacao]|uniref:Glucuronoxylan 4-O-methyltransferase 1 n=1 Tax=Theobroma cacao TaxID=3641 RepID=A0AB32VEC2_THECC|nr:PREDICTED: glucuronoxylan 4-O-methyltransferase 1 [Theobroma cacao]